MKNNNASISNQPNMEWVEYIYNKKHQSVPQTFQSVIDLNMADRERYAWAEYFDQWTSQGYKTYHLVLTYKESKVKGYTTSDLERVFKKFYMRYLLKKIVGNNYTEPNKIKLHPVTICFFEEHESKANATGYYNRFAERYHIHAMIAAHPDTIDKMERLLGENTLDTSKACCSNIMTSFLAERDPQCVLYASKDLNKDRQFMLFGGINKLH